MSPVPLETETQQDQQLQSLARAYEALLLTAQELSCKEQALQQRLKFANDEYCKLADQLPGGPDANTSIVSDKILGRHSQPDHLPEQSLKLSDVINSLRDSGHVADQMLNAITEGLESYQSIVGSYDRLLLSRSNPCLVAVKAEISGSLERDFTTPGNTQGSLRCPFAKSKIISSENGVSNAVEDPLKMQNGDTCGHEDLDPIKAELNDRRSSQSPSARTSSARCPVARCPIRFLNQHTPEEVADYVERHKHEIPRSHAICVKRYQRDSQSMRHLDAKYGNLTNMIRGLSVKHQAFLPQHEQNGDRTSSSMSTERVEKWAEDVSPKSPEPDTLTTVGEEAAEDEDDRKGHFDRPLREVRVGESPSRPWGIPVPYDHQPAISAPHSPAAPVPASIDRQLNEISANAPAQGSPVSPLHGSFSHPQGPPAMPTGRCPFGHRAPRPENRAAETETLRNHDSKPIAVEGTDPKQPDETHPQTHPEVPTATTDSKPAMPANVVFNGPVFFGYSAEQTAALMQQLGSLHNVK